MSSSARRVGSMRRTRYATSTWLLAVLALILLPEGRARAQTPTPASVLLRWQENVEDVAGSYLAYSCEYLIHRDGLTTVKCLFTSQPDGPFERVTYSRGTASPTALATLRKALTQNHIGLARAEGCHVPETSLPTSATWAPVLTWFGKAGRQNRLVFNDPFNGDLCTPELLAVVEAVVVFVHHDLHLTDPVTTLP